MIRRETLSSLLFSFDPVRVSVTIYPLLLGAFPGVLPRGSELDIRTWEGRNRKGLEILDVPTVVRVQVFYTPTIFAGSSERRRPGLNALRRRYLCPVNETHFLLLVLESRD